MVGAPFHIFGKLRRARLSKVGSKGRRGRRPHEYHSLVHLATDYIHPTPRGGRCRVRVWLPEDERDVPVVVCTELPTNEGPSITYAAEQLAAEVIRYHKRLLDRPCGSSTTPRRQQTAPQRRLSWLCS
jgi:hypothetical protein